MRRPTRPWVVISALIGAVAATAALAQNGGMTCIECHADPLAGGFHGGFRNLTDLTPEQVEVICLNCHDGSYTNPQGIPAPEAAVHQNKNPGQNRDEYGDFKATCLDCHATHTDLLAGDGTTANATISTPNPDPDLDEFHDVDAGQTVFFLDETTVTAATIVLTDDQGTPFTDGVDYEVRNTDNSDPATSPGDPRRINVLPGGAIAAGAPQDVYAAYEFGGNQQLLGVEVVEANSSDKLARTRKPIIDDVNGDNNGSGNTRFEDDQHIGWECNSGIPDDPACAADDVRELVFHDQVKINGTDWAPTIISFQPVSTSPPRNGACNSCHTRASHHRRNDLGEFGGGDDHTHNISRSCDDCHNHKDGWVNKGG